MSTPSSRKAATSPALTRQSPTAQACRTRVAPGVGSARRAASHKAHSPPRSSLLSIARTFGTTAPTLSPVASAEAISATAASPRAGGGGEGEDAAGGGVEGADLRRFGPHWEGEGRGPKGV